jgi:hypothetical protein
LQVLDPVLSPGLLVAPGGQAEERLEGVVTGQGGVALVQAALAALEEFADDGSRVIPPDLTRHAAVEGEGPDHAGQDGLGALRGQGHGKGGVGVGPGGDRDGHQLAAVGEIDVDVAEVGLEALTGVVGQGEEGLAVVAAVPAGVAADLVVAAGVGVLVTPAAEELPGGVPLLGRGLLIGGQEGVDDGVQAAEDGGGWWLGARGGRGLGVGEDLAHLVPGVVEGAGDLVNGHAIAVREADLGVVVHRQHPCLRSLDPAGDGA